MVGNEIIKSLENTWVVKDLERGYEAYKLYDYAQGYFMAFKFTFHLGDDPSVRVNNRLEKITLNDIMICHRFEDIFIDDDLSDFVDMMDAKVAALLLANDDLSDGFLSRAKQYSPTVKTWVRGK